MSYITILDVTDPNEIAAEIDRFSHKYARRTGDYDTAGTLAAAAEWLVYLSEKVNDETC